MVVVVPATLSVPAVALLDQVTHAVVPAVVGEVDLGRPLDVHRGGVAAEAVPPAPTTATPATVTEETATAIRFMSFFMIFPSGWRDLRQRLLVQAVCSA
ncbi:hypothetical protein [Streptomyces sp. MK7]|uniref:hypothetical protein n=1 Tax=Streptomyces sp. MK7 TaxID=3067635 RepID=UPI0029312A33|nr:hypothetical protein [Streptomyces sp. MK7]